VATEVIHDTKGLRIVRNGKNQFVVITLHHTADPDKCSPAWRKEAHAGMSDAQFAREYDIDYGAMFGERVFPEMLSHKDRIVVGEPYPAFPSGQVYFGGFDYGMRNPSAFNVYTIWDGIVYAVWELYEPCRNINDFSAKLLACPYWDKLRWIAADTHIADLRHYGSDGLGASVLDQFVQRGIHKFVLAPNSEDAWLTIIHKHWGDPEEPTFKIFDCCPNLIREFGDASYVGQKNAGAVFTANAKEGIADVNNHALDACKYLFLMLPKQLDQKNAKYPSMVRKWIK
jgi:hypothetical protein